MRSWDRLKSIHVVVWAPSVCGSSWLWAYPWQRWSEGGESDTGIDSEGQICTFASWPTGAKSQPHCQEAAAVQKHLGDPFFCTPPTEIPKVFLLFFFFPAVHREERRSSTSTGIFSTKSALAQMALQVKSFSYKCAHVMELISSFLRVINKQAVSKAGKGERAAGYAAEETENTPKISGSQEPLCPKLELLRSTQLPNGSGHLLSAQSLQQLFPKGLWAWLS